MQLFYAKDILSSLSLDSNESYHCKSVLRKKIHDDILVTDGNGLICQCKIQNIKNEIVELELITQKKTVLKRKIELAIGFPKNRNRIEWLLEKVTEIGVHKISPLICDNSERKKINFDRCEKILISSMKQSFGVFLPKMNKIQTFSKFVQNNNCKKKYIAHCNESSNKKMIKKETTDDICIMIGPEGDFSSKEISLAKEMDFKEIKISNNRLRTETAAIVSCYKLTI